MYYFKQYQCFFTALLQKLKHTPARLYSSLYRGGGYVYKCIQYLI